MGNITSFKRCRGAADLSADLSRQWDQYEHRLNRWRSASGKLKENLEPSTMWLIQEVADTGLFSSLNQVNVGDLSKYIEKYVAVIKSNIETAYQVMRDITSYSIKEMAANDYQMQCFWSLAVSFHSFDCRIMPPLSLLKEINALRLMFETVYQRIHEFLNIHKHSTYMFYKEELEILDELKEADAFTVKLLQKAEYVARFISELPSEYMYVLNSDEFIYKILNPVISSVRDRISKLNELMQATVKYAEFINEMAHIIVMHISIIALLLFICQPSPASATDMKQLTIFATVIHLIISGDVESNPGPFGARDLLRKEPKISDLHRIFIQSDAACYWKTIESNLGFVFERWRQKYEDVTWERIIQVCKDYEYGRVCHAISKFLSSREAHSTYGSEPDFDSTYTGSMTIRKENENGYSTKTVHGLLIILIAIIIVLCNIIYQMRTEICQC
ncbi:PREDICTED: uncharacterized protein LOC109586057 isoform X2 [Amphimedon queenslandica]|uniref:Uncharacterized protein n=1 Tax=Amphimedon queenslandica TaxID=400682 RepID=A0A1X7TTX7_AMPQE|nr:PREDICTED: uncharacterized protein LOC109586057 isoform X2 [Amphimedon queenslandica]|eukprot:XP_019857785.1 PREDICTED: uncharacterized protein LOC109586057 isoform X2 [Amphimedon queenslandica]